MSPQRERGPPDYPSDPRDEVIERLIERMGTQTYHEGPDTWVKWMIGLTASLVVGAISGGIAMYAKVSALEERTQMMQGEITEIKRLLEPRYRGTP